MDQVLTAVFNHFLAAFCEPLNDEAIQLSLLDGLIVRDLVIRPETINAHLKEAETDLRIDGGRIGFMRLCYTALPGVLTMQMSGVDIRIRPNALKTLGRVMKNAFTDLTTKKETEVAPNPYNHVLMPGDRILLSPTWHDPSSCPMHRMQMQGGMLHSYFCNRCAIPNDGCGAMHIINLPPEVPTLPVIDDDALRAVSPRQLRSVMRPPRIPSRSSGTRQRSTHSRSCSHSSTSQSSSRVISHTRQTSLPVPSERVTLPHHRAASHDYPTLMPLRYPLTTPDPHRSRPTTGLRRPLPPSPLTLQASNVEGHRPATARVAATYHGPPSTSRVLRPPDGQGGKEDLSERGRPEIFIRPQARL